MKKTILFILACILSMQLISQNFNETILLQEPGGQLNSDWLGSSVSVDGNYAIVGAPQNETGKGYAIVYQKKNNTWEKVAQLTASNGSKHDAFGYSVDISGNVIVVGTPYCYINNDTDGCVYVFEKPSTGWKDMTETAKLTISEYDGFNQLGFSVSISGNVVVAGAPMEEYLKNHVGAAYVFEKPESGWGNVTETAKLTSLERPEDLLFGKSVSIYNNTIVIGATGYLKNTGMAFVFEKPEEGWKDMNETIFLQASDGSLNDYFGNSVSIYDDVIVVGACKDGILEEHSGSAYIFVKTINGWENTEEGGFSYATEKAKLKFYKTGFGCSVSISGDLIAIGSRGTLGFKKKGKAEHIGGSAYLFKKPAEGWKTITETVLPPPLGAEKLQEPEQGLGPGIAEITASDIKEYDFFGYSVAISEDMLISGAPFKDDTMVNAGAAYMYMLGPQITSQPANQELVDTDTKITFDIKACNTDTYLWQVSTDDGKTFTNLTNGDVYSGENTATLNVKTAMEQNNNQYRCIVTNSWSEKASEPALLTIKSTTGIPNTENIYISVYPNPVKDILNIQLGNNHFGIVEIYDLTGQKVKQKYCTGRDKTINLSSLKTGIYILNIRAEKQTTTTKIIKK